MPMTLSPCNSGSATTTDFEYVLIFSDAFTGDAIDLNKWNTGKQLPVNMSNAAYFDNGANFEFEYPGPEQFSGFVFSKEAKCVFSIFTFFMSRSMVRGVRRHFMAYSSFLAAVNASPVSI